jgi:type IV secretory pathway TrbD component
MYATCLFCNEVLGRNEAIEAFPVGQRLAFDAARGRLWVVCRKCERWNLSPLEERWEAIEQAERLYRDTRKRVATENIGLAKLPDGTTLVRIGTPLRPEFAAWRYGDQFGRRRRRQMLLAGGGSAVLGALITGGMLMGVGVASFGWIIAQSGSMLWRGNPETVVATLRTADGRILHVRRRHLGETVLTRDGGDLAIDLRFKNGQARFVGDEAHRIASIVVPKVNRNGGNRRTVAEAVQQIEEVGSADAYLDRLTLMSHAYRGPGPRSRSWGRWGRNARFLKYGLFSLPAPQRLALEMALHEEAERRALEGELHALEHAWREAEEVAGISDNLLLPTGVNEALESMKGIRSG